MFEVINISNKLAPLYLIRPPTPPPRTYLSDHFICLVVKVYFLHEMFNVTWCWNWMISAGRLSLNGQVCHECIKLVISVGHHSSVGRVQKERLIFKLVSEIGKSDLHTR